MTTGWLYFITYDAPNAPIKIGFTTRDPYKRLREFQTAFPWVLRMLGNCMAERTDEHRLLRRLARHKTSNGLPSNEWFHRHPDVITAIAEKLRPQRRRDGVGDLPQQRRVERFQSAQI